LLLLLVLIAAFRRRRVFHNHSRRKESEVSSTLRKPISFPATYRPAIKRVHAFRPARLYVHHRRRHFRDSRWSSRRFLSAAGNVGVLDRRWCQRSSSISHCLAAISLRLMDLSYPLRTLRYRRRHSSDSPAQLGANLSPDDCRSDAVLRTNGNRRNICNAFCFDACRPQSFPRIFGSDPCGHLRHPHRRFNLVADSFYAPVGRRAISGVGSP